MKDPRDLMPNVDAWYTQSLDRRAERAADFLFLHGFLDNEDRERAMVAIAELRDRFAAVQPPETEPSEEGGEDRP